MAHVEDVARPVDLYHQLGFEPCSTLKNGDQAVWAWVDNGKAHLMLVRSARPMNPRTQDVIFYLYAPDVASYRAELAARRVKVGPLTYPAYMPEGEFRVDDPDGYCLLIRQSDEVSL
jgi:Glyoxalase/Bleomycin resistance protein/Dioxygenase superfamily